MSIATAPVSPFEQLTARSGDELAATALATAAQAGEDQRLGSLVVVVHPERDDHRVLAASGIGVLRAAVSVAVAAGNDRLWSDAPVNDTIEHTVRSLPEVIRAAAEASHVVATHTGTVRVDDRIEAVAIWFESATGVASAAQRRSTLDQLAAAADRDAERSTQVAADEAAAAVLAGGEPAQAGSGSGSRQFDPTDPDLDPVTGVANRERFERALEQYDSDQAALVIIDIDYLNQLADDFDSEIANKILLEIADRLVNDCRKLDLIARIDADTFCVLYNEVDRATALQISKRLSIKIAEPLSTPDGPEVIMATIALAHQFGLVDTDELLRSATDALISGKKTGHGGLFLGS